MAKNIVICFDGTGNQFGENSNRGLVTDDGLEPLRDSV